jgi:hypothetical protein
MADEFIKIFTKEQLQQMDKDFLIERNLLLDDQIKMRIAKEEKLQEVIEIMLETSRLYQTSFNSLYGKYQFVLSVDDPELLQKLETKNQRLAVLRQCIIDKLSIVDDGLISDKGYLASEWMDGGQTND